MAKREPIFNVPWPVMILLGIMIVVHIALHFLPEQDAMWWLLALAFIPARYGYSAAAADLPGGHLADVTSFISHLFVHGDNVHLAVNGAWLLAFGTPLAKRLGWLRFSLFTLCCGVAGAAMFLALHVGLMAPVVGASGAIAGLMGGVLRFMFPALDSDEGYLLRDDPSRIPALSLFAALRDRRILAASAAFVALNLVAMFGLGSLAEPGTIAWEAHLGGYFFGLLCFGLFDIAPQFTSPTSEESPSDFA